MFTENKITEFTNKISALADRPQMSAQALKAWFDASAEELRVKHNALIDALSAFAGNSFSAVSYNAADGKLQFTFGDGSVQVIDLPLELLIKSGDYDAETQSIMLTLANGDKIVIPVAALVDTYTADNQTLVCDNNTFSVKDGVFVLEAPKDGKPYARTNGSWKAIVEGLPHIRLSEADGITAGLYIVDDAFADWAAGTSENPLSGALLIVGAELYGEDYENSVTHQTLVLPCGELWWRYNWGAWQSVVPSLAGYAKTADVNAKIEDAKAYKVVCEGELDDTTSGVAAIKAEITEDISSMREFRFYIEFPVTEENAGTNLYVNANINGMPAGNNCFFSVSGLRVATAGNTYQTMCMSSVVSCADGLYILSMQKQIQEKNVMGTSTRTNAQSASAAWVIPRNTTLYLNINNTVPFLSGTKWRLEGR